METTAKITSFCSSCRSTKLKYKFMGFEVKGSLKQFRTCNNYHNRHINMKKRQEENEKNQEIDLKEIIKIDNFYDYITEIFQLYLMQVENNTENTLCILLSFQCNINISIFNKLEKEIADKLVESIEDIDGFV